MQAAPPNQESNSGGIMPELTQARLKELLHYDSDTGIFIWIAFVCSKVKIGDVAGHRNQSDGYIKVSIDNKDYLAHRLAWLYIYGEFPPDQIDHINHIRNANWINNLRLARDTSNKKNQSQYKSNTSGYTGVYWCKPRSKWVSQININGKNKYLGSFVHKKDAIESREKANTKYGFH